MKYKDLDIKITSNKEESEEHIEKDYNALVEYGVDNLIKEKFIPWLLGENFPDKEPEKVLNGLKLYEIEYYYGRIVAQYSPNGEDNYFGKFQLCFESGDDYTSDILEAAAMEVFILDGKVQEKTKCFDI